MSFGQCVIGGDPITASNDSEEHIILNAIGGARTTTGFICTKHNSTTGTDWDAELAAQLNGLCHIFAIKRDRGVTPDEKIKTTEDETFVMLRDGGFALPKPSLEKKQEGQATRIQIQARDMREARKMLVGLKRKYPNLDIEAALATAAAGTSYPAGLIHILIQIGGEKSGRSIVKSALAFAHDDGISTTACEQALAYLQDEKASPCFGYYQSTDLVGSRPAGVPIHCVAIDGNPVTGLLLGYVEYFGFLRMVVCLSKSFVGGAINHSYAIDPTTGQEVVVDVRLPFKPADVEDIYDYKHCGHEDTVRSLTAVLGPAMARKNERERRHVTEEAVRHALENSGVKKGEMILPEHAAKIGRLVAERLTPYILNLNRPRRAPPGATFYPIEPGKDGAA